MHAWYSRFNLVHVKQMHAPFSAQTPTLEAHSRVSVLSFFLKSLSSLDPGKQAVRLGDCQTACIVCLFLHYTFVEKEKKTLRSSKHDAQLRISAHTWSANMFSPNSLMLRHRQAQLFLSTTSITDRSATITREREREMLRNHPVCARAIARECKKSVCSLIPKNFSKLYCKKKFKYFCDPPARAQTELVKFRATFIHFTEGTKNIQSVTRNVHSISLADR